MRDSTLAVHAGDRPDPVSGALDAPLVLSSTFAFDDADEAARLCAGAEDGYVYGRWANPTVAAFEAKMAALEAGTRAVATASGMGAVFAATMSFVGVGDHVVAPAGMYAETARLLREPLTRAGVEHTLVDMSDPGAVERSMRATTRIVWVETPANPTLAVYDIATIAEIATRHGALVVADNTFATPYHQRPLALGAHLVMHSATKAIGGHGDAIGGVVVGKDEALVRRAHDAAVRTAGNVMSPFVAWQLARGLRTLPLRAARSSQSALELARRLEVHPNVSRVHYPGLESHPAHTIAKRQMRNGFGGVLAFELRGGLDAGRRTYDAVALIARAVSLGDVRSLITHPASTTHASIGPERRNAAGIGEGLLRLSVGIEDVDDLWEDLERAIPR